MENSKKQTAEEHLQKEPKQSSVEWLQEQLNKILIDNQIQQTLHLFEQAKQMEGQQERMYSKEDLREAFTQGMENMDYCEMYGWSSKLTEQQWFEQFKNK